MQMQATFWRPSPQKRKLDGNSETQKRQSDRNRKANKNRNNSRKIKCTHRMVTIKINQKEKKHTWNSAVSRLH